MPLIQSEPVPHNTLAPVLTGARRICRGGCVSAGSGLLLVVRVATRSETCWLVPPRGAIPLRSSHLAQDEQPDRCHLPSAILKMILVSYKFVATRLRTEEYDNVGLGGYRLH